MSIFTTVKGWFSMLLKSRAKEEFNIETIGSDQMSAWINECVNIYQGNPSWLDEDDHIDTINFAKAICSEVARLTTLGIGIHVDGSSRADWLQKQIDKVYFQLRHWVEYGSAYGTIILKPNGDSIDLYTTENYEITHVTNGEIDGVVFHNYEQRGKKWYTRLEYHRFEDGLYRITNKCFVGDFPNGTKERVDIELTPWAELAEDAAIQNVESTLFGVMRMPHANNIDLNSPFGLPVFSEAIQELRDLDIAYSRNSKEISDSKRTVLLDSYSMIESGTKVAKTAYGFESRRKQLGLPDMVRNVSGDGKEMFYQEINPSLNTDTRLKGINALLSQIGYKVGFSNGYFVFNETSGIQTATQVEAEQQRTIQLVKDVRDKLEACLNGLIYALNVFADLYGLAPSGAYEVTYDFSDITYSFEEERAHHYQLAIQGHFPWEEYYVRFLGYAPDEARRLLKMAKSEQQAPSLFGSEE